MLNAKSEPETRISLLNTVRQRIHARCLLVLLAVIGGVTLSLPKTAFGWSIGHNDSSWLAATLSPEPFASNPKLCLYACYPDAMGDWNCGYSLRLFSFEAINALRAGDAPKALFLASAATHYLTDGACIAHSHAWYKRENYPWERFLPKRYQGIKIPRTSRMVYYSHLKREVKDTVLDTPEPEYNVEKWRQHKGSINAYFDTMPSSRRLVTPDLLRKPTGWTFNDCDQYCRWYGMMFIALDMIAPESLGTAQPRLRDALGIRAINLEELLNGAEMDAAYYGYLSSAANAMVEPSLDLALPDNDKLLSLAGKDAVVLIPEKASWPVERAAHVLGMEMLRATRRAAVLKKAEPPKRTVASFVVRVPIEQIPLELGRRSAVLLLPPNDPEWAKAAGAAPVSAGKTGLVSARKDKQGNIHVLLRGTTEQDTLYMVDYLLDLAWAPLHARWPAQTVADAAKEAWAGWKLILDLRRMQGKEAVAFASKVPYKADKEAVSRFHQDMNRLTQQPASQEEWWTHFLFEIPLPDGRRVPDMIEKGADYSKALEAVKKQP